MTNEEAIEWLESIRKKYIHGGDEWFDKERNEALDLAISALSRDRWISDPQEFPNTDARVVGYFGGGAFDQYRWFDFVTTLSDGSIVPESTERDIINEHLIALYQLPEPPKEET